jgi:hypothetical protein
LLPKNSFTKQQNTLRIIIKSWENKSILINQLWLVVGIEFYSIKVVRTDSVPEGPNVPSNPASVPRPNPKPGAVSDQADLTAWFA